MACGVNPEHWWAKGSGERHGTGQKPAADGAAEDEDELRVTGCSTSPPWASAFIPARPATSCPELRLQKGAELRGGISVDQVLANNIGQETAQPSLVLGCEQPITGYHETNFSMAYSSHISWQNATSPVPMEVYPSLAFDSLFDNRGNRRNQSVLDRVKEHAASLSRQVSAGDKAKLDEYLTSVREVEKRIERMRDDQDKAADRATARGQTGLDDGAARTTVCRRTFASTCD